MSSTIIKLIRNRNFQFKNRQAFAKISPYIFRFLGYPLKDKKSHDHSRNLRNTRVLSTLVCKDGTCLHNCISQYPEWSLIISHPFRSSLEAQEKPSNIQHFQKQKCVTCDKIEHNGIRERFRICAAPHVNKFLQAAIYMHDEIFTKTADLEDEKQCIWCRLVLPYICA